jgi:hypothetical protein
MNVRPIVNGMYGQGSISPGMGKLKGAHDGSQPSLNTGSTALKPFSPFPPGYTPFIKSATLKGINSQPRFGSCMCPICLSIGLIENAYDNVGKIKEGATVEVGSVMRSIAAQTSYDYMVHENATRLLTPAKTDENRIRAAVMDRTMLQSSDNQGTQQVELKVPPEGGLFTTVFSAFTKTRNRPDEYRTYPKSLDILPVADISLTPPGQSEDYNLLSIVHQMYPEDSNPQTTPVSMGYILTRQVESGSRELALLSTREFPTMENMDAAPAGLTNLLGLLAFEQYGSYDSLAVVVEPHQTDLKRYIKHLQTIGIPVKSYVSPGEHEARPAETLKMPAAYERELLQLFPQTALSVYRVDLAPLKQWLRQGLPQTSATALGKSDPSLAPRLEPLTKKGLSALELLTVLRVPPRSGSKVFDSQSHNKGEEGCHLPDLSFGDDEHYPVDLAGDDNDA